MRLGFFTYGINGERMTGIARYAVELTRALHKLEPGLEIILLNPYPGSDLRYCKFKSVGKTTYMFRE